MKRSGSFIEVLRARVARAQLIMAIGLAAAVVGAVLSSWLLIRLQPVLELIGPGVLSRGIAELFARLWVLGLLPVFGFGAARVADLKPWPTAAGAAASGEALYLALDLVHASLEGFASQWAWLLVRLLTLAGGIVLTQRAIVRGRRAAERVQQEATRAAEAKKSQYDEFAREAERLAALNEQRTQADPPTPTEPPKPDEPSGAP